MCVVLKYMTLTISKSDKKVFPEDRGGAAVTSPLAADLHKFWTARQLLKMNQPKNGH